MTIRPTAPVRSTASTATLEFTITPRIGSMAGIRLTMLGLVQRLDSSDVFGSDYKAIPASFMAQIAVPATPLMNGINSIEVPVSGAMGDFAFFELFAEATGSDGRPFTTAAGFIPFRNIPNTFEISILSLGNSAPVNEIRADSAVILRIKSLSGGAPFADKVSPIAIYLASRGRLLDPSGNPVNIITDGITGSADITVVFPAMPEGGREQVLVAGRSITSSKVMPFFGASSAFRIVPDPTFARNVTTVVPVQGPYRCEVIDLQGRVVQRIDRIEGAFASGLPAHHLRGIGHGVYIVRLTDYAGGRVMRQTRHLVP